MARAKRKQEPQPEPAPEIAAGRWAVAIVIGLSVLLAWSARDSGDWRGVLVTEVQIIAVAWVAWRAVRTP